jgi:hypothetical protein
MNADEIKELTDAYIECALWSSLDDSGKGEFLDQNYGEADISEDAMRRLKTDAEAFYMLFNGTIRDNCQSHEYGAFEMAGHDLWLTQHHHGSGFWDGGWKEPAASVLTAAAESLTETTLYVGDDGKIHI